MKDRERRKFEAIFEEAENQRAKPKYNPTAVKKPLSKEKKKIAMTKAKKEREKDPVVNLVDALSTQPQAPLHFGMELSLCSNFADPQLRPLNSSSDPNESRFLTVSHPDGHTQVLRHSLIRAGAGEYRGGIDATQEKGPTDVAVFKVRRTSSSLSWIRIFYRSNNNNALAPDFAQICNLNDMKMNRAVKYGEPVWFVVVPGKNKSGGHWSEGSVLGAKVRMAKKGWKCY